MKKQNKISITGSSHTNGNGGEKVLYKYQLISGIALRSRELGRISERQLESIRRSLRHNLNGRGDIRILKRPDRHVCKKGLEVRMGKGKGEKKYKVIRVKPGIVRVDVKNQERKKIKYSLIKASIKLPIKTNIRYI